MASVTGRLARLERISGTTAADRAANLRYIQQCSEMAFHAMKGLDLVLPEDTDERTYAEIEILRLTAQGRHTESDEWRARYPLRRVPPPDDFPEGAWRELRWAMTKESCPDTIGLLDRERKAIAAARARLARTGGDPHR